ncbi:FG-GAP repeat domain-containing protein [Streptomyces sp. SPB074]|uniref:FG-GAP repeat domain-containing protein n=1 Tax=Streptomyces sp. (strain SPB074) TaxID=465543 RepID=UPI00017F10E8|nr:VCBS repeat-containing protein [Streptomyces sp. SPB074]EDY46081.1 conserved hypothetical protein [Streptomyces sp. SPB074]
MERSRVALALAGVVVLGAVGTASANDGIARPVAGSACRAEPRQAEREPDIDGDGHGDVLLETGGDERTGVDTGRIRVRYGGGGPARTAYLTQEDFGLRGQRQTVGGSASGVPAVADLDGDGADDVVTGALPAVRWGGPRTLAPTRLSFPYRSGAEVERPPVAGDFDGDGHPDLASLRAVDERTEVVVLHGPFTRQGRAARTEVRRTPAGAAPGLALLAAEATGDGADDLLVHEPGAHTSPYLLPGGTGRHALAPPVRLPRGDALAVGDYDGDGRPDLAIGDSGVPDDDGESPVADRRGRVLVVYGRDRAHPVVVEGGAPRGGFGLGVLTADLDGDGCDDLAVRSAPDRDLETDTLTVLHGGSAHGLGSSVWGRIGRGPVLPLRAVEAGDGRQELLVEEGRPDDDGYWAERTERLVGAREVTAR